MKADLEKVAGKKITDEAIWDAIKVYNKSRAARREFVKLANAALRRDHSHQAFRCI